MLSYSDVEKLEMTAKASNAKEPAYNGLKKKKPNHSHPMESRTFYKNKCNHEKFVKLSKNVYGQA